MFVITVIPIKKGFRKESLSYFSKEPLEAGSVIKAPIRGKNYFAIVTESAEAESLKAEIKSSSFALKKADSFKTESFFGKNWQKAVKRTAQYSAATSGEMLFSLIPSLALENLESLAKDKQAKAPASKGSSLIEPGKKEILAHQAEEGDRILNYKSAVREAFAKKSSVFISLPTNKGIKEMESFLEKGIEEYTFAFFSDMPRKEFINSWKKAAKANHPVLVIGSPIWTILPREDFQTIILEKENSAGWKTLSRPYVDLRKFMEMYAEESGAKLIFGDTVLRAETLWRYKNGEAGEFEGVKWRIAPMGFQQKIKLIEMRKPEAAGKNYESEFRAVGKDLLSLIARSGEEKKNIFIYTTRKGLAPITVCRDCGEEVVCNNCASPVVLYKNPSASNEANFFRCHQCGETRNAKELCHKCGSWRLVALGVGIERVVEEIKEALPNIEIFQIHKEADGDETAAETADKFYTTPGSVLVGTEMALHYLREPVSYSAIASIDPLFFVPDFRIREKIFRIALNVKLLAKEECLAQIRKAEKETLELALSGNIADFYKMEIKEREALQYPPFSVFLKITARGNHNFTEKESKNLESIFEKWQPTVFHSTAEKKAADSAVNCVIKLPMDKWPDEELRHKIMSLPPYFEIKIDPDNLL